MPKTYVEEMAERKEKQRIADYQRGERDVFKPKGAATSVAALQRDDMKKLTQTQEQKMNTFIDEMRQNFLTAQNANQIP